MTTSVGVSSGFTSCANSVGGKLISDANDNPINKKTNKKMREAMFEDVRCMVRNKFYRGTR
jgi:hypothetical protein